MGRFMIVSKVDKLDEYVQLAKEYGVAFELNDFFEPEILDDEVKQQAIVTAYKKQNLPENVLSGESASKDLLRSSTLHGAFYDIAVFSQDKRIRDTS